eukprot:scaffold283_cov316-Pavlova_lutheri.AAC.25
MTITKRLLRKACFDQAVGIHNLVGLEASDQRLGKAEQNGRFEYLCALNRFVRCKSPREPAMVCTDKAEPRFLAHGLQGHTSNYVAKLRC